jgi:biotin operon repressor
MRNALIGLLILAYLSTLAMSAGHLAQWYALSLGELPPWLAWGLAGSLEFTAFLLSLLSNSLLRGSSWASGGALAALLLVWMGNALSMRRAAPELPLWETLAMSLFVPVGTWVVGKVVGELVRHPLTPAERPRAAVREGEGSVRRAAERLEPGAERPGPNAERLEPGAERGRPNAEPPFHAPVWEPNGAAEREARLHLKERKVETERSLEVSLDERGLAILQVLRSANAPLSLSELARRTGMSKSTLHVRLNALADSGVVVRSEEGWTLRRAERG